MAETLNDLIVDSPRYHHYVLGSGTIEGDKWSVVRIQASEPSIISLREGSESHTIIANIIFRPENIELYHINQIDTKIIDIFDQLFIEKILIWLGEHGIGVDHSKVKALLYDGSKD